MKAASAFGVLVMYAAAVSAAPVHVGVNTKQGPEYGAGYSVARGNECFVVTPHHVVEWAVPDGIKVTDTDGHTGTASVVKVVEQFDAALLKVEGTGVRCAADWVASSSSAKAIQGLEFLVATKPDDNGRVRKTRLFVSSTSNEFLELEPYGASDHLREGDSGSSLYAGDVLVGMVQQVDTKTGRVTAITQSQLHGLFGADLLMQRSASMAVVPFQFRNRDDIYATTAIRDYLGANTSYMLMEATADRRTGQPIAPAGADYVLSGRVVDLTQQRIVNPNYKPENQRDKGFGSTLMNSVMNKNEQDRFLFTYHVDVEITLLDVAENSIIRNLERREYQIAGDNPNPRELEKSTVSTAVTDALKLTFEKYELP